MRKSFQHNFWEIGEIAAATALLAVPAIFARRLLEAQPSLPALLEPWSGLSQGIRIGVFATYYGMVLYAFAKEILDALRRIRMPRHFQQYCIYGKEQDTRGTTEVRTSGGGTASYSVIPVNVVYERFYSKYGRLRLLELFGKLYPIVILAEHLALRKEDVSCKLLMDPTKEPRHFKLTGVCADWKDELLKVHEEMRGSNFASFDDLARLRRCVVRHRLVPFGKRLRLCFEICNYLDYIVTNYSVDLRRTGTSVRDYLDNWPTRRRGLPALRRSPYANQLGVNAMLVTCDGKMIAAARSDDVFTYPSLHGPPVSGTQMYWYKKARTRTESDGSTTHLRDAGPATDYYSGYVDGHGIPNPFDGVLAQAYEEIKLNPRHVRNLRLIGLSRDLTRGGLPDAFFVAHLNLTYEELFGIAPENARDSWERKKKHGLLDFGPPDIRKCLSYKGYRKAAADFRQWLAQNPATPALVSGIYFFLQYLKSYRDEF